MNYDLQIRKKRAQVICQELKKLFPVAKPALDYSNPWELLVAVILSAQCTDNRVNIVTKTLFKKYPKVKDYVDADTETFQQDIRSTGFYKNKAKNILATAKIIHETYHDTLPKTMKEMIMLPGVARKTANVVLSNAFGVIEGLAVDTHVRRLSQKFGLTKQNDPSKIEQDLMQLLEKEEWSGFSLRLVDYGRAYSPARKKDYSDDPISQKLQQAGLL
ncbi:endonuclease III [Candidatus Woesebacteria bacterium]|nr:endonuclease III [Candidatus Woesebacteria bacterium]